MNTSGSNPVTIGQRLRAAREFLGLSQTEVATAVGVTLRTYARWERAETATSIVIKYADELEDALQTPSEELFAGPQGVPSIEQLLIELNAKIERLEALQGARSPAPRVSRARASAAKTS